ncbi:MAG: acyl carrier protein [Acidobacteriaceae bacterium]|nr:acyl carrier protein [Acidobacteriaceae bacterium]
MQDSEVYDKLTGIFRDVFDDDSLTARPDLSADQVDEWDSLSHIRLMLTVERAFNIKFSAGEIGKLKNVGDLVHLIEAKQ